MMVSAILSTDVMPKPKINKPKQAITKEWLRYNVKLPIAINPSESKKLCLLLLLSAYDIISKQPNARPTKSIAFINPSK